jgi:membrane-bound lytic murein transglycosylase D
MAMAGAATFGFVAPMEGVAQERPKEIEQLADDFNEWMRANLDDDVLAVLSEVDHRRVVEVLTALVQKLDATDIYDLASARQAVVQLLPVLKQFDETRPYAIWLETRLEYLDAAESLRHSASVAPRPPKPNPEGTRPPLAPPTADALKKYWDGRLGRRPIPGSGETLVPRLKQLFRAAGVPAELVWLAEVESSLEPRARSPKGAVGLYQLMPATARGLGLSTWPFDDRLNVDDNTQAAARYLKYLYGRFGDWRLVLAAYNAGEGRVRDLLASAKARTFAAIAARLPAETQLYVPRFEATLRRREGVSLNSIGSPRK